MLKSIQRECTQESKVATQILQWQFGWKTIEAAKLEIMSGSVGQVLHQLEVKTSHSKLVITH